MNLSMAFLSMEGERDKQREKKRKERKEEERWGDGEVPAAATGRS